MCRVYSGKSRHEIYGLPCGAGSSSLAIDTAGAEPNISERFRSRHFEESLTGPRSYLRDPGNIRAAELLRPVSRNRLGFCLAPDGRRGYLLLLRAYAD